MIHTPAVTDEFAQRILSLWSATRAAIKGVVAPAAAVSSVAELRSLGVRLAEIRRRAEPDFVQLAGLLETLHTSSTRIGAAVESQAGALRTLLEDETFYGTQGVAERLLRQSREGLESTRAAAGNLQQVSRGLIRLEKHADQLRDTVKGLETSTGGFAIESARSPACQQAFGSFVDDLRSIVDRVHRLAEAISSEAGGSRQNLASLLNVINKDLTELGEVARACESSVEETQGRVRAFLSSSAGMLSQAGVHTRKLAASAGEVVYHLQFGDIVRQKLEHVSEALDEAAESAERSGRSRKSRRENASSIGGIAALQAGQLELVAVEITTSGQRLTAEFESMADQTSELARSLQGLSQQAKGDSSQCTFEKLSADLERLHRSQARGGALREQAQAACANAIDASTRVAGWLGEVEGVNHEMHLQALNAIIATEHLRADGRTLGVLSTFLHQRYQALNGEIAQIATDIAEIREITERIGDVQGSNQGVGSDIVDAIQRLARMQEDFVETGRSVTALLEEQNRHLENGRTGLHFVSESAAGLTVLANDLAAVAEQAGGSSDVHKASLVALSSRYTMQSEREVHERLLGGSAPPQVVAVAADAPVPAPDAAPKGSDDTFGENVELF